MLTIDEIMKLLAEKGCVLTEEKACESFGNYYLVYKAPKFDFIIIRDRSHISIDLVKKKEKYDLALVFILLSGDESYLSKSLSLDTIYSLLKNEFDSITLLFSDKEFKKTEKSLFALEQKRAKMLFGK